MKKYLVRIAVECPEVVAEGDAEAFTQALQLAEKLEAAVGSPRKASIALGWGEEVSLPVSSAAAREEGEAR